MTSIIIPSSGSAYHPLRDALRTRSERTFSNDISLSAALSKMVERTARVKRMRNPEVLGALLTAVASCVQAMAPTEEWDEVGMILADELRARLSVRQVN